MASAPMTGSAATRPAAGVALAWLVALSVDVRAAAVLDAAGAVLAGDRRVAARAAAALAAAPRRVELREQDLLVVRGARVVAAAVGPHALTRLHLADLRAVVAMLDGPGDADGPA
jgi:hypothetical protein